MDLGRPGYAGMGVRLSIKSEMMTLRLMAALVLLCFCAFAGESVKKDSWSFINSEISLGTIRKDQAVPVTFQIKNESGEPVKIASAEGACRCTSLVSAPDQINAHGRGTFKFLFSPARVSKGAVTEMVMVDADDGRTLVGTFNAFVK